MVAFTAGSSPSHSGADPGVDGTSPRCSAKGCRDAAGWALNWRNPGIHRGDRVKLWLACDPHRAGLEDFLARRGFLLSVQPLDQRVNSS